MVDWLVERLREGSTQRGIVLLITAVTGFNVPPEVVNQVILIGISIAGALGVIKKEGQPNSSGWRE